MGAKENLALVEGLQEAARQRDWDHYGQLLADRVIYRMAGVPQGLGGTTEGREAVLAQLRDVSDADPTFEVRDIFGDDTRVCVIGKVGAPRFPGNQLLKGADHPYQTYECVVYRVEQGKVAEATTYINWLDVYSQVGLVEVSTLTR
jgi:ketosteroid isomerase-like protein